MPADGRPSGLGQQAGGLLGLAIGRRRFGVRLDSAAELGRFPLGQQVVDKFEQSLAGFGVHRLFPFHRLAELH